MATPQFSPFVTFTVLAGAGVTKATINADLDLILGLLPDSANKTLGSGAMPDTDAVRPEWEQALRAEIVALKAAITAA